MTGGRWFDGATKQWICAGKYVLQHLSEHLLDAKLLGVAQQKSIVPGSMTLAAMPQERRRQERESIPWAKTYISSLVSDQP